LVAIELGVRDSRWCKSAAGQEAMLFITRAAAAFAGMRLQS